MKSAPSLHRSAWALSFHPWRSQAERLASLPVCATRRSLAWPGWETERRFSSSSDWLPPKAIATTLVSMYSPFPDLGGVGTTQACWNERRVEARRSSRRLAVGRNVKAPQRTRLREIGKSENVPLSLQLCAPAVIHNCRQGATEQHILTSHHGHKQNCFMTFSLTTLSNCSEQSYKHRLLR